MKLVNNIVASLVTLIALIALVLMLAALYRAATPAEWGKPTHAVAARVLRLTQYCRNSGCYTGLFADARGHRYALDFGIDKSLWQYLNIGDTVTLKLYPDSTTHEVDFHGQADCLDCGWQ